MKFPGTKTTPFGDIPTGMLNLQWIHVFILKIIINLSLRNGCFPHDLNSAEVSVTFKKNEGLVKYYYRPVNFLPHMSKFFERTMHTKTDMSDELSKFSQDSKKIIACNHTNLFWQLLGRSKTNSKGKLSNSHEMA